MKTDKLNKLEQIAIKMLQSNESLIYNIDDEAVMRAIATAFKFAELFIDVSEDSEMSWNKGDTKKIEFIEFPAGCKVMFNGESMNGKHKYFINCVSTDTGYIYFEKPKGGKK